MAAWVLRTGKRVQSDQLVEFADITVQTEFLVNMSASADVLAMAKVEVDLNTIPEGKNVSSTAAFPIPETPVKLTCPENRSSSSGVVSPSSSVTAPLMRLPRPTRSTLLPSVTLSPTTTVSSSPSGSSCWVC